MTYKLYMTYQGQYKYSIIFRGTYLLQRGGGERAISSHPLSALDCLPWGCSLFTHAICAGTGELIHPTQAVPLKKALSSLVPHKKAVLSLVAIVQVIKLYEYSKYRSFHCCNAIHCHIPLWVTCNILELRLLADFMLIDKSLRLPVSSCALCGKK